MREHEYEKMVKDRNGLCDICKMKPKKLRVDHDHKTGKMRGLLCDVCNKQLGLMDDKVRYERALAYLKR